MTDFLTFVRMHVSIVYMEPLVTERPSPVHILLNYLEKVEIKDTKTLYFCTQCLEDFSSGKVSTELVVLVLISITDVDP